jgi:hypothetical protein
MKGGTISNLLAVREGDIATITSFLRWTTYVASSAFSASLTATMIGSAKSGTASSTATDFIDVTSGFRSAGHLWGKLVIDFIPESG